MASLTAFKNGAIDTVGVLTTGTASGTVTDTDTNLIVVTENLSALSDGDTIVVTENTGLGEKYTVESATYDTDHTDIEVYESLVLVTTGSKIDKTAAAGVGDDVDINGKTCTASSELSLANLTDSSGTGSLTTSEDVEITTKCDLDGGLILSGGAVCTFGAYAKNTSTISGDCVFSGLGSMNALGGSIIGDCEFSGTGSLNDLGASISGACVFSGEYATNAGAISGDATLSGTDSACTGTVSSVLTLSGYNASGTGTVGLSVVLASMTAFFGGTLGSGASVQIASQSDLAAGNILSGKTILQVAGMAYGDTDASKVLVTASVPGTAPLPTVPFI